MWQVPLGSARRILCLGAHSDDIEIGLGGTLLKLIKQRSDLEVWWIVFSAPGYRAAEAQESANDFLSEVTIGRSESDPFAKVIFPANGRR
jgi:LmbE family N-acetylglucosaminyl deacetylase